MTKVPVLFIVFNRPDKTQNVLQQIAAYKPDKLYISADGPRRTIDTDADKCKAVRKLITEGINWPCELFTLYNEENKGCRKAVSNAISWFFKNELYGIILEDDCFPDLSFFDFSAELLKKYENDKRFFSISGSNFGYKNTGGKSYLTSRYMNMWGWATWRRTSDQIDYELAEWNSWSDFSKYKFLVKHLAYSKKEFDWGWIKYWKAIFDRVALHTIDTWDYQWLFFQFKTEGITIVPSVNLVQNIGFDMEATHTTGSEQDLQEAATTISFPLKHINNLKPDRKFEENFVKQKWAFYKRLSLLWHFKNTIYELTFPKRRK